MMCMVVDSCVSSLRTKEGEINRFVSREYTLYAESLNSRETWKKKRLGSMKRKKEWKRERERERERERGR